MSLCYREQRQLRDIQAGLFRSDSHLAGHRGRRGLARILPLIIAGFTRIVR